MCCQHIPPNPATGPALSTHPHIAPFHNFAIPALASTPLSHASFFPLPRLQFVYVNCKSIRRLDFLQKAINTAFAPCLALLRGRGGADGQGVVRRVRNPNESSGQRQVITLLIELFGVTARPKWCTRCWLGTILSGKAEQEV